VALTDPLGGQWQWAYSETGLLMRRVDPAGQATAYAYERGQLRTITDARPSAPRL
jgi:YD repeat-containing protein